MVGQTEMPVFFQAGPSEAQSSEKFKKLSPTYPIDTSCMCVLVTQSCLSLCDPMDYSLPGSSVHGHFQARMLEWISHSLLQGILLTQGSNLGLLHAGGFFTA